MAFNLINGCNNNPEIISLGIKQQIYLLPFENVLAIGGTDKNYRISRLIKTIDTNEQYSSISGSNVAYNLTIDGNIYKHTLSFNIGNSSLELDNILPQIKSSSYNQKRYLVFFKLNNSTDYYVFGTTNGATLNYSRNYSDGVITINLTSTETEDLFRVLPTIVGEDWKSKKYIPIYTLYKDYTTVYEGKTIYPYALITDVANRPLKTDNTLANSDSERAFVTYKDTVLKIDGVIKNHFYTDTVTGESIYVTTPTNEFGADKKNVVLSSENPNAIVLFNDLFSLVEIQFSGKVIINDNQLVLNRTESNISDTEYITVKRNNTNQYYTVYITNKAVVLPNTINFTGNVTTLMIPYKLINIESELLPAYSHNNITNITYDNNNLYLTIKPNTDNWSEIVTIRIDGIDYIIHINKKIFEEGVAVWSLTNSICEVINGNLTGNIINTFTDTNPNSPTYNQIQTTTETSTDCVGDKPVWFLLNSYCEVQNGTQTGNKVYEYIDLNKQSATYNMLDTKIKLGECS